MSFARPVDVAGSYGDSRWRNTLTHIDAQDRPLLGALANHLCRRWDAAHPAAQAAREVELIFMAEYTLPDDPAPPAKKERLIQVGCDGSAGSTGASPR